MGFLDKLFGKAKNTASDVADKAAPVVDRATDKASDVVDRAKDAGSDAVDEATRDDVARPSDSSTL